MFTEDPPQIQSAATKTKEILDKTENIVNVIKENVPVPGNNETAK